VGASERLLGGLHHVGTGREPGFVGGQHRHRRPEVVARGQWVGGIRLMRSPNSIAIGLLCRLEVAPKHLRLSQVDVLGLVALVGVVVHQRADHARQ